MKEYSNDSKTRERVIILIKGVGIATQSVLNPVGAIGLAFGLEVLCNAANDFCDYHEGKKQKQQYLDNYIDLLLEASAMKKLEQADKEAFLNMTSRVLVTLKNMQFDHDDLCSIKAVVAEEVRKQCYNTNSKNYWIIENTVEYALTLIKLVVNDKDTFKYLVDENIQRKDEIDHLTNEINDVNSRVNTLEQNNACRDEKKNPDSFIDKILNGYSEHFTEALYLNKDNSNVNLKNLFVIPDVSTVYKKVSGSCNLLEYLSTTFLSEAKPLVLLGDAGSGKTTIVSWLAYKFYVEKNSETSQKLFGDKQLLIVKLRDVNKGDIRDEGLYDAICRYLHVECEHNTFRDKYVVLDGMDEISLTENYVDYKQYFIELHEKFSDAFKLIITSRSSVVSSDTIIDKTGKEAYSVYKLDSFSYSNKLEWIRKYEKCTGSTILEGIKDRFLSTEDDTIFDYPQLMYMIAGEKQESGNWSLDNEWSIYHHIFYDVVFSKEYDGKTHPFNKYRDTAYRLLEIIAYEMYLKNSDEKIEKKRINDLLARLDDSHLKTSSELLDAFEKYGYGMGCYWNIGDDAEIEFYHNNIRDYFIAEYIYRELNNIFSSVVRPEEFAKCCESFRNKTDGKLADISSKLYKLLRDVPISGEVVGFLSQRASYVNCCDSMRIKDEFTAFLANNVLLCKAGDPFFESDSEYPFSEFIKELFYDLGIYCRFDNDIEFNVVYKISTFLNTVLAIIFAVLNFIEKDKYISVFGRNTYLQNELISSIYKHRLYENYVYFNRAYLLMADFSGAFMYCPNFNGAYLENALFENSEIEGAGFDNAVLKHARFLGTKMSDSSFEYANLSCSIINNSSMESCDFTGAIFGTTLFSNNECYESYVYRDGNEMIFKSEEDFKSGFGPGKFINL